MADVELKQLANLDGAMAEYQAALTAAEKRLLDQRAAFKDEVVITRQKLAQKAIDMRKDYVENVPHSDKVCIDLSCRLVS